MRRVAAVLSAKWADGEREMRGGGPAAVGATQGHAGAGARTPFTVARCQTLCGFSPVASWKRRAGGKGGAKRSPLGRGCPSGSTWLGLAARHAAARPPALRAPGITASRLDAKRWAAPAGPGRRARGWHTLCWQPGRPSVAGGHRLVRGRARMVAHGGWWYVAGEWHEGGSVSWEVMQSQK